VPKSGAWCGHVVLCTALGRVARKQRRSITRAVRTWRAAISMKLLRKFMLPHPKRRFWKSEPTFQSTLSKHFSAFCSPNMVLTPLKSASTTYSERLVRTSKIFVWKG
jgi:hypothetical protein